MWELIKTSDPETFVNQLNDFGIKPNGIIKIGSYRDIRVKNEINIFRVYVEKKREPKKKRTAKKESES